MTDIIKLERALVSYFADRLNLKVDKEIYRGGIPDGLTTAVAVRIGDNLKESRPMLHCYRLQILGRHHDRDGAIAMIQQINDMIPAYDFALGDDSAAAMLPDGGGEPFKVECQGAIMWQWSVNLLLHVR